MTVPVAAEVLGAWAFSTMAVILSPDDAAAPIGILRQFAVWWLPPNMRLTRDRSRHALSRSAFSAVEVVAIIRAPKTWANCGAKTETPPEPWVRTVSPAVIRRWPVRATQAVTAAHGKVAASSKETWRCT